jgi:hypothetical protein
MKSFIETALLLGLIGVIACAATASAAVAKPHPRKPSFRDILAKEKKLMLKQVLADERQALLLSKLRARPAPRSLGEFDDHIARRTSDQRQASAQF